MTRTFLQELAVERFRKQFGEPDSVSDEHVNYEPVVMVRYGSLLIRVFHGRYNTSIFGATGSGTLDFKSIEDLIRAVEKFIKKESR